MKIALYEHRLLFRELSPSRRHAEGETPNSIENPNDLQVLQQRFKHHLQMCKYLVDNSNLPDSSKNKWQESIMAAATRARDIQSHTEDSLLREIDKWKEQQRVLDEYMDRPFETQSKAAANLYISGMDNSTPKALNTGSNETVRRLNWDTKRTANRVSAQAQVFSKGVTWGVFVTRDGYQFRSPGQTAWTAISSTPTFPDRDNTPLPENVIHMQNVIKFYDDSDTPYALPSSFQLDPVISNASIEKVNVSEVDTSTMNREQFGRYMANVDIQISGMRVPLNSDVVSSYINKRKLELPPSGYKILEKSIRIAAVNLEKEIARSYSGQVKSIEVDLPFIVAVLEGNRKLQASVTGVLLQNGSNSKSFVDHENNVVRLNDAHSDSLALANPESVRSYYNVFEHSNYTELIAADGSLAMRENKTSGALSYYDSEPDGIHDHRRPVMYYQKQNDAPVTIGAKRGSNEDVTYGGLKQGAYVLGPEGRPIREFQPPHGSSEQVSEVQKKENIEAARQHLVYAAQQLGTAKAIGAYISGNWSRVLEPKGSPGLPMKGTPDVVQKAQHPLFSLIRGEGDCEDYALLAVEMLAAIGINALACRKYSYHFQAMFVEKNGSTFDLCVIDTAGFQRRSKGHATADEAVKQFWTDKDYPSGMHFYTKKSTEKPGLEFISKPDGVYPADITKEDVGNEAYPLYYNSPAVEKLVTVAQ